MTTPKVTDHEIREKAIALQKALIANDQWRCCLNCDHWLEGQEECERWAMTPPSEVIVLGCVHWTYNIPF